MRIPPALHDRRRCNVGIELTASSPLRLTSRSSRLLDQTWAPCYTDALRNEISEACSRHRPELAYLHGRNREVIEADPALRAGL